MSFQIRVPFQGSVQAQGFAPAQAPDTTQQLRQNAQTAQQNIKREDDLASAYRGQMQAAKKQRETMEAAMQLEELQEFSGTIKNLVMASAQAYKQNKESVARVNFNKEGHEKVSDVMRQTERELAAMKEKGLLDQAGLEAKLQGMPYLVIDQLKGMGGFEAAETQRAAIEMMARSAPSLIKGQVNSLQDRYGQKVVTEDTTPVEYAGILEEVIQSWYEPYGGLNQDFRAKHIDVHIDPARKKLLAAQETGYARNQSFKRQTDLANKLMTGQITMDGYLGSISSEIKLKQPGQQFHDMASGWEEMMSTIKKGIDSGLIKRHDIPQMFLEASDGEGSTYAERFGNTKLLELQKYEQKKMYDDGIQAIKMQNLEFQQKDQEVGDWIETFRQENDRLPTEDELDSQFDPAETAFTYGKQFPTVTLYKNGLSLDDTVRDGYRKDLQELSMLGLLRPEIVSQIPDYNLQREFMPQALEQVKQKKDASYDDYLKSLDQSIRKAYSIGPKLDFTVPAQHARQFIQKDFARRYMEYVQTMPPASAAAKAADDINKEMTAGTGMYERGTDYRDRFPKIGITPEINNKANEATILLQGTQKAISEHGKKALSMQGTFGTKEEVQETLDQFASTGKVLDGRMRYTAGLMDESPLFILKQAANAYKLDFKLPEVAPLVQGTYSKANQDVVGAKTKLRLEAQNGIRPVGNNSFSAVPQVQIAMPGLTPQQRAFLRTIMWAEGTHTTEDGSRADPYGIQFGGSYVAPGGRRNDTVRGSRIPSAASGAYQAMPDTWDDVMGSGVMTTRANQDMFAMKLIRQRCGLTGNEPMSLGTIAKCAPTWASLPTMNDNEKSYYQGQKARKYSDVEAFYNHALAQEMASTY